MRIKGWRHGPILAATVSLLMNTSSLGADYHCAEDAHVIAACFDVHGRSSIPANSRTELWEVGTRHVFGLQYPADLLSVGGELVPLPENVAAILAADPSAEIFGDLRICPFTSAKRGEKQYACVERAEKIVVRSAERRD